MAHSLRRLVGKNTHEKILNKQPLTLNLETCTISAKSRCNKVLLFISKVESFPCSLLAKRKHMLHLAQVNSIPHKRRMDDGQSWKPTASTQHPKSCINSHYSDQAKTPTHRAGSRSQQEVNLNKYVSLKTSMDCMPICLQPS